MVYFQEVMPALETAIPDKKQNGSVSASGDATHEVIELSGEDEAIPTDKPESGDKQVCEMYEITDLIY